MEFAFVYFAISSWPGLCTLGKNGLTRDFSDMLRESILLTIVV